MERPWVGHKAYDGELVRLWKSADAGNPDGVKQAHSTLQSSAPSPHMAGFGKWVSNSINECGGKHQVD